MTALAALHYYQLNKLQVKDVGPIFPLIQCLLQYITSPTKREQCLCINKRSYERTAQNNANFGFDTRLLSSWWHAFILNCYNNGLAIFLYFFLRLEIFKVCKMEKSKLVEYFHFCRKAMR